MSKRSSKKANVGVKPYPRWDSPACLSRWQAARAPQRAKRSANTPPTSQPVRNSSLVRRKSSTPACRRFTRLTRKTPEHPRSPNTKIGPWRCWRWLRPWRWLRMGHGGGCGGCGHGGCGVMWAVVAVDSMEAADAEASALEAAVAEAAAAAAAAAAVVGGVCIWPWPVGWCWGESTPPAKVASVASERTDGGDCGKRRQEYRRQN